MRNTISLEISVCHQYRWGDDQPHIDEFYQLVNVLPGHMSVVGPMPHMHKDSRDFAEGVSNYSFRNLVRPKIKDISQVREYRGPATTLASIFPRYQGDVYYVRNVTFLMDIRIVTDTAVLMAQSPWSKWKQECGFEDVHDRGKKFKPTKIA